MKKNLILGLPCLVAIQSFSAGLGFQLFSGSHSKIVGQINGLKIKPNHNFFDSYAGSKGFIILIVQFKKHLFLLTNELKLMNFSVSDKILFIQIPNWSSVYCLNYCLFSREKIIMVVLHEAIFKLRERLEKISYQFCEDKPTQLHTLEVAKRQLMISTCNFNLYQNKITKPKSRNSHKSIENESFQSDRETMKMQCRKDLQKIRHFKSVATSRISFDKSKSKYIRIIYRFKFKT